MEHVLPLSPRRAHLTRLMTIWRSAGWPCRDAIELDLLAAGWATLSEAASGHEIIRLSHAGIRLLAECRQRNQRAISAHDRLAERVAEHLIAAGRIVWRELSLRARVDPHDVSEVRAVPLSAEPPWLLAPEPDAVTLQAPRGKASWRMARPDVYSVRHTSVEDYLQPIVHEVKVSRADLLSDLRHAAKRICYQWLSCETYYVFPAGVAAPEEVPPPFGVWLLNGTIESGTLDLVRPALHVPCKLPFAVWMALARATPVRLDGEPAQLQLGDVADSCMPLAGDVTPDVPIQSSAHA